jgi:hypothetical protein
MQLSRYKSWNPTSETYLVHLFTSAPENANTAMIGLCSCHTIATTTTKCPLKKQRSDSFGMIDVFYCHYTSTLSMPGLEISHECSYQHQTRRTTATFNKTHVGFPYPQRH